MKKFLVLLCVGCLMVGGCGQAEPKDTATTVPQTTGEVATEPAIEEPAKAVSDAAVESTDTAAESDAPATPGPYTPVDPDSVEAHLVTTHEDKNVEPDNSVEYFPDIKNINDLENGTLSAMTYDPSYKEYNYTVEHRTFDFLKEGDTQGNFTAIASYIKNEYLEEMGAAAENYELVADYYVESTNSYSITFLANADELPELPENLTDENLEKYAEQVEAIGQKFNGFVIYRTIDDPNNGVTILYVENADKYVLNT